MGKPNFDKIEGGSVDEDSSGDDKPSFDAISGEETDDQKKDGQTVSKSYDEQLIIKGKWGNVIKRRDEGCCRCGDKATCVVTAREENDGDVGHLRGAENACDEHKEEVAQELDKQGDFTVIRDY